MKLYKLTNQKMQTHDGFQWEIGKQYTLPEVSNPLLCTEHVYHAYKDINLAYLLNPIHADISNPRVFEADGKVVVNDYGKVGCFNMKLTREIKPPDWTGSKYGMNVRLYFALLSAKAVLKYYEAKHPDDKRPRQAIEACEYYIKNPSDATAYAATYAANATYTAAYAATDATAYAAAYAATYAAHAATHAANATYAATYATAYAAQAAQAAAYAAAELDFPDIAKQALELAKETAR